MGFFHGELKPFSQLDLVAPITTWPNFFSSAVYAFEGIGCVLPVFHGMEEKAFFTPINGVLNTAMTLVTVMYFSIGFFGYLKYGSDCLASITLNLPVANPLFQSVKICFAIAVFITFNLQFLVGCDILWSYILRSSKFLQTLTENNNLLNSEGDPNIEQQNARRNSSRILWIIENGFRSIIIIIAFALAMIVPRIDLFIALIGAIASSTLAIIVPICLDLLIFWPQENYCKKKLAKDVIILLFGTYIFFAGTYTSLFDIVEYLSGKD